MNSLAPEITFELDTLQVRLVITARPELLHSTRFSVRVARLAIANGTHMSVIGANSAVVARD
jgi:hypothetical protein